MRETNQCLLLLALCACPLLLACNATCIRDSDCMGTSICSQNRCILVVRGDAGGGSAPSPSASDETRDDGAERSDAGGAPAPRDGGER